MVCQKDIKSVGISLIFLLLILLNLKYSIQIGNQKLAIFMLIGVVGLFWGLFNPKKYIYSLLLIHLIWPLVSQFNAALVQVGVLAVAYLFAIIMLHKSMRQMEIGNLDIIDYLLLAQIATFLLSYNKDYGWYVWFWGVKQEARMVMVLLAIRSFEYNETDSKIIVKLICIFGFLVGAYAVYQYFFDYNRLLGLMVNEEDYLRQYGGQNITKYAVKRAYSFILSPLTLGYLMVSSSTLSFIAFVSATAKVWRNFFVVVFFSSVGALLLSFTRTAWAAFFVAFLLLFYIYPKGRKYIIWMGIFAGICFVLLFGVSAEFRKTVEMRVISVFDFHSVHATAGHYETFGESVRFIKEHPKGIGLGTATHSARFIVQNHVWTESGYLSRAVQTGLVGMGVYLATFIIMIIKAWKSTRSADVGSAKEILAVYCVVSIVGLLAADTYGYPFLTWNSILWLSIPFAIVCPRKRSGASLAKTRRFNIQ